MNKASKKNSRPPVSEPARQESRNEPPRLPPPRKRPLLLLVSAVAFFLWFVYLVGLAWYVASAPQ